MNSREYCKSKADELKQSLKIFPSDFIYSYDGDSLSLPPKMLYLGKEFFGKYEIVFFDDTPWRICSDLNEAKFIIYARHNGFDWITIPIREADRNSAVKEYEKYLDLMMKEIRGEFFRKYPSEKKVDAVTEVFRLLNLVRY